MFLDGANDTNEGGTIFVKDWNSINLAVASAGTSTMTVKFVGSFAEDAPNFAAAASQSNLWDYVEVVDLDDGSAIDGATGISFAGADAVRQFEVNVSGLTWFGVIITAYTQGNIDVTWLGLTA